MKKLITAVRAAIIVSVLALVLGTVAVPAYAADNLSITEGASSAKSNDQGSTLFGDGGIFQTVTNILLYIIGAVSVIMLVIGGIRYTVSGGDSSQVTSAKNTILYAIIGIVVALLAYAVVNFVLTNLVGAGK